ncbi:MAG: tetratricopeptide repeat protein, partial [Desulfosudaceae bacterium]
RLLLEEKRYNEALEECSQVLRIFPLAVEAIRLRGDICLATGDYELAIWNYSQAIDLDDQPAVYRKRGRAYIKTGQTEKACADFARACREIDCTGEDFSEWRKDNCP